MQGLRRTSDTRKASDSLAKLSIAHRSVRLIGSAGIGSGDADQGAAGSSGAASRVGKKMRVAARDGGAAEKTATTAKSAAAATRSTAAAGRAIQSEDDSSAQAADWASDLFERTSQRAAVGAVRGTAQVARGGAKLTGKAVKGGIIAAQKRAGVVKAAHVTKTAAESAVTVSRGGAALARAGASAVTAVKGMVAAVATAASSTPVIAIIIGILVAILAVLSIFSWLPGMTSADEPQYGNGGQYPIGVAPGPWGGHENGRIPQTDLAAIPWAGGFLRADATASLAALNEKYRAQFGSDITVISSYRDYAGQVAARARWCAQGACRFAAVPGTSNHGWALAADLGGGINSFGTAQHAWMKQNAPTFGWRHPAWAEPSGSTPEPWHWEFWGWEGSSGGGAVPDGAAQTYANNQLGVVFGPLTDRDAQFACLQTLWMNESGWNHTAQNPTSSAYGIPQALPGRKMSSAGDDWRTNPETQIKWGLQYIKDRYKTPCQAWDFWQSKNPHWY